MLPTTEGLRLKAEEISNVIIKDLRFHFTSELCLIGRTLPPSISPSEFNQAIRRMCLDSGLTSQLVLQISVAYLPALG